MTPLSPPPREKTSTLAWGQWVEEVWRFLKSLSERAPAGSILAFGGSSAPTGYLICDGTAYLTATYPDLFAAIGNSWDTFNGAADPGDSYFRVPDLRGRAPIGVGTGSGLTARALAAATGTETHTLSESEMPDHNHTFIGVLDGGPLPGGGGATYKVPTTSAGAGGYDWSQGGNGGHNNMQPSAAVNFIIKT